MPKYWIQKRSIGNSSFVDGQFGYQNIEPLWVANLPDQLLMADIIFDESHVYYLDNKRILFSLDIDSGQEIWRQENISNSSTAYFQLNMRNNALLVCSCLVNKQNGEVLFDLKKAAPDAGRFSNELLSSEFAIKEVNRKENPGVYLSVNIETLESSTKELGFIKADPTADGQHMLGFQDCMLVMYNFEENNFKWRTAIDAEIGDNDQVLFTMQNNKEVIVASSEHNLIQKFDLNSGLSLGLVDFRGKDTLLDENNLGVSILSDEALYIQLHKKMLGLDMSSGELMWTNDLGRTRRSCGAGDLIYGIINEKNIVAWDRYTGEEKGVINYNNWEFSFIKASGNRLFLESNRQKLLCFKWDTPYISPHRPT